MAFTEKRKNGYMIRCNCGCDSKGKRIVRSKAWTPPAGLTPRQIEKELAKAAADFQEEPTLSIFLYIPIRYIFNSFLPKLLI